MKSCQLATGLAHLDHDGGDEATITVEQLQPGRKKSKRDIDIRATGGGVGKGYRFEMDWILGFIHKEDS